jgi:long-chain acyl-CoA synthetase
MAILGLGDLKTRRRGWFRSGTIEVRVGKPLRFGAEESEATIAAQLQMEVEGLMGEAGVG